jgi:hypothetical protein
MQKNCFGQKFAENRLWDINSIGKKTLVIILWIFIVRQGS